MYIFSCGLRFLTLKSQRKVFLLRKANQTLLLGLFCRAGILNQVGSKWSCIVCHLVYVSTWSDLHSQDKVMHLCEAIFSYMALLFDQSNRRLSIFILQQFMLELNWYIIYNNIKYNIKFIHYWSIGTYNFKTFPIEASPPPSPSPCRIHQIALGQG